MWVFDLYRRFGLIFERVSLHFEMTLAYMGVSVVITMNLCK